MNLRKRSNGYWYVEYTRHGKRVQQSTKTKSKREALAFLTNLKKNRNPIHSITLSSFIGEYIQYSAVNKARRTTEMDKRCLLAFLNILGDKRISSYKESDIEKFKVERVKIISKTTVNIELRTCRAAFNIALKWQYLENNPFKGVKLFQVPKKGREYFKVEEINFLLANISQQWLHDVVIFALNTGCRRGEVTNLKWDDINIERREINIRHSLSFTVKGRTERTIPMNDAVFDLLYNKNRTCEFVLTNASGGKLCPDFLWKLFKKTILRVGLNPKFHFHHLRHTFATLLIQQGVPIYEVQKLLGHKKNQYHRNLCTHEC